MAALEWLVLSWRHFCGFAQNRRNQRKSTPSGMGNSPKYGHNHIGQVFHLLHRGLDQVWARRRARDRVGPKWGRLWLSIPDFCVFSHISSTYGTNIAFPNVPDINRHTQTSGSIFRYREENEHKEIFRNILLKEGKIATNNTWLNSKIK